MRTECPKCKARFDVADRAVLSAAGRIVAKRRAKAGTALTSEAARAMQLASAAARAANRRAAENP